jgi:hypothetical protein
MPCSGRPKGRLRCGFWPHWDRPTEGKLFDRLVSLITSPGLSVN